jgi:hypothetical protein
MVLALSMRPLELLQVLEPLAFIVNQVTPEFREYCTVLTSRVTVIDHTSASGGVMVTMPTPVRALGASAAVDAGHSPSVKPTGAIPTSVPALSLYTAEAEEIAPSDQVVREMRVYETPEAQPGSGVSVTMMVGGIVTTPVLEVSEAETTYSTVTAVGGVASTAPEASV